MPLPLDLLTAKTAILSLANVAHCAYRAQGDFLLILTESSRGRCYSKEKVAYVLFNYLRHYLFQSSVNHQQSNDGFEKRYRK